MAPGVVALGLNVPVPPPTTVQRPVAPPAGLFPPRLAVVPKAQIVCGPPTVAVGCSFTVIVTSANEAVHGGLEIVHLSTIPPVPLVGVKVAPGVLALGLNVPVAPPVCIVHIPVPVVGVLPPSDAVVEPWQMVCGAPTVAGVGG